MLVLFFASLSAGAQSFNIDLETFVGNRQTGYGPPSSGFGGAADSPGFWNAVDAGGPTRPINLYGLDGAVTPVQMVATGGTGSYGGYNFSGNTGDYAALLNDYAHVEDEIDYHFSGLAAGPYVIYTYVVRAGPPYDYDAYVTVPGSLEGTGLVTGPMPGNQFIEGITHSVHHLTLTEGTFEIDVHGPLLPYPECNGFQIVAVPEPTSLAALGLGVALLCRKRRSRPPLKGL